MTAAGRKPGRRRALGAAGVLAAVALLAFAVVTRAPSPPADEPLVVNDVTRLNPIRAGAVLAPTETREIVEAVRASPGPVAIGGARHSMGGQIAAPGGLHLDMRRFNRVIDYSPADRRITVQAGATWRQIQSVIDPDGLSISIMQSYANFTVGGSLSVNVHGRYVGLGPIIQSVRSFQIVLADGSLVEASPAANADVFYGAIGGYGGLGVITEATLALADNIRVKRTDVTMAVSEYRSFFFRAVRSSEAVFHNADLYPDAYATVHAVTFTRTDDPVTVPDRLRPAGGSYRMDRLGLWLLSDWPFANPIRQHLVDPLLFRGEPVVWRNYEASYDAALLEPASRRRNTHVLQEYFVPIAQFEVFATRLREILRRHAVNVLNVSVRHATADPGSLLAWAPQDVFAFVLYYEQGTGADARQQVGVWTRELIDAALDSGGSYYLPYQVHATRDQFLRAYPRAPEYFAVKRRRDPTKKFQNALWLAYFPG